jgi:hypothetical protein
MTTRQQFATSSALARIIASAGLTLALLMATLPSPTPAGAFVCLPGWPGWPYCPTLLGIAGGGAVSTDAGDAHLSLMATNITSDDPEATAPLTVGQVHWWAPVDGGAPILLESTVVEEYGPMPDNDSGRVIRGLISVNGEGEYPFVVRAIDGGLTGEAVDYVEIQVGDAVEGTSGTGFTYAAEGPLTSGDVHLIAIEFEPEAGASDD